MDDYDIRKHVREAYGKIPQKKDSPNREMKGCCEGSSPETISCGIGYTEDQLSQVPAEANLGLGCGNPIQHADLKPGETVLDLGSGGGIDCFLAAKEVGDTGKVIGVDMTPEMLDHARRNAQEGGFTNVEFRLGEIENLPAADNCVDAIISNCVINLAPDKLKVFREAFRVLKPGGRLVVADIVLTAEPPEALLKSLAALTGCITGASMKEDYLKLIKEAGFRDVKIIESSNIPIELMANDPTAQAILKTADLPLHELNGFMKHILSIKVIGWKP